MFIATCFDSNGSSSGYVQNHICVHGNCTFWDPKRLTGLSYKVLSIYRVIRNDCRGFNNLSYIIHLRQQYMCFFINRIEHSKFLLHTLQVLYMCTLCDSTNINAIIEFVPHVSDDGFSGGSDSYLHFRDKHAPCILKLCVPPSNGIGRWWLFSPNLVRNCSWTFVPRQSF